MLFGLLRLHTFIRGFIQGLYGASLAWMQQKNGGEILKHLFLFVIADPIASVLFFLYLAYMEEIRKEAYKWKH